MLKKNKDSQFDLNKVLLFNELNVSIYKQWVCIYSKKKKMVCLS